VFVILDKSDRTDECLEIVRQHGFDSLTLAERVGCNEAICKSLRVGFDFAGTDFNLHVEDDVVLSRDAIHWFWWARDTYRNDKSIFSVSGWQRKPCGLITQCGRRMGFCPWGWGTWRDRWDEIKAAWPPAEGTSWDVHVTNNVRGTRFEAYPAVSRVQNIGESGGEHINCPDWHEIFHAAVSTSDDAPESGNLYFTEANI
jgi:hypothetical protein